MPEAVVVQFNQLSEELDPFLADVPRSVAIPLKTAEWYNPSKVEKTFIRKQFPLVLSWAFTIHKSQGKTLDQVVIDLGKSEKCSGMTLVALSRVRRLNDLLLKPFSLERLKKTNNSNQLPIIQRALERLKEKAVLTKNKFEHLWNNDE